MNAKARYPALWPILALTSLLVIAAGEPAPDCQGGLCPIAEEICGPRPDGSVCTGLSPQEGFICFNNYNRDMAEWYQCATGQPCFEEWRARMQGTLVPDEGAFPDEGVARPYIVEEGDTIESIAAAFGIDPDTLRAFNNIPADGQLELVGPVIMIPPEDWTPEEEERLSPSPTAEPETKPESTATPIAVLDTPHALIFTVTGTMRITRGGESWTVSPGDYADLNQEVVLNRGDIIETTEGSHAQIVLFDGSVVELAGENRFSFAELDERTIEIQLDRGDLISTVAPNPERERFEIRTVGGVIGVRGTQFEVITDGVTARVIVYEGVVEVQEGDQLTAVPAGEEYQLGTKPLPVVTVVVFVLLGIGALLVVIQAIRWIRRGPPTH